MVFYNCKLKIKLRTGKILCYFGFHKIRKGFGWSHNKRADICLRTRCKYLEWFEDEEGIKEINYQSELYRQRRRVLLEKRPKNGCVKPLQVMDLVMPVLDYTNYRG